MAVSICTVIIMFVVGVAVMFGCVICCVAYGAYRRRHGMSAANQPHYQAINLQPGPPPGELITQSSRLIAETGPTELLR